MGTHTPRRLCKATASPHPLSEIHLSLLLLLILRWDQTFGGTDQALEQIKMESTNFYPTIPLTLIIKTNVFTKLEKVGQLEKSVYYLKSLNICELKSVNWHIQWNEHLALELYHTTWDWAAHLCFATASTMTAVTHDSVLHLCNS